MAYSRDFNVSELDHIEDWPALDALTIGCNADELFALRGGVSEVRVFEGLLPEAVREAVEMSLARRVSIEHPADAGEPPAKRRRVES